jgi:hypothetical protein
MDQRSPHRRHRSTTLGIAALAAAMAACLPRGAPPGGRQVVADRQATLEAIVPPNGDGVLRILILKPGTIAKTATMAGSQDLYLVSVAPGDGPPSEQLLVPDADPQDDFGCINMVAPCSLISPSGILWVYGDTGLVRINPFTGAQLVLQGFPQSSASGQRFFVGTATGGTLYEPDGSTVAIDLIPPSSGGGIGYGPGYGSPTAFFGEDFYYVSSQAELVRLPPSDVPEQLATGIAGFSGSLTPQGTLLTLSRATSDPNVQALSVRDPLTGTETVLPFSDLPNVSPDGQWLLDTDTSAGSLTFFNFRSGAQQVVALPDLGGYPFISSVWRPGTSQLWFTVRSYGATPAVWIVSPGGSLSSVPGVSWVGLGNFDQELGAFTPDGAHWFFTASGEDANAPLIQVGATDDPTGPGFPVIPQGTMVSGAWSLADGRVLTSLYTDFEPRSDVFAINPNTGETVQLAERGRVAAVGNTRLVGMFHFDPNYRGDLTAVELDDGRQTILAPEFAVTAFVEPQGADLVPPGARVVYQFQARTDSPYDGIWVVNSP